MRYIFLLLVSLILCHGCKKDMDSKKILFIVAHSDDDTTIGPVLSKLSNSNDVYQWIITDGRFGTEFNDHTKVSIVPVRKQESICSCNKLGIHDPVFFDYEDGLGIRSGMADYFDIISKIKMQLRDSIANLNPDMIITFGPDGDTGHPDHRIVGNLVTEIILQEGWFEKFPIYFLGWSKEQGEKYNLNYLDTKYFNVAVKYSKEDEKKYFESIKCYESQFLKSEIEEWIDVETKEENVRYFRKFTISSNQGDTF